MTTYIIMHRDFSNDDSMRPDTVVAVTDSFVDCFYAMRNFEEAASEFDFYYLLEV